MFRNYKALLRRNFPARTHDLNYELIKYGLPGSNPTLKCLPDKPLSDEVELKCVYIINTAEYILDVVPQIQAQIEDKIDQEYLDSVELSQHVSEQFQELIKSCVNSLVVSLCARNDQIYQKHLNKINWKDFETTGAIETMQYMVEVAQELKNRVALIKKELNPVYFNLVANKLVQAIPSNFLLNVYKIKKVVSAQASSQFLYDAQNELKNLLLSLPQVSVSAAN